MKSTHGIAACAAGALGMIAASAYAATAHTYTAETHANASKQGKVTAGPLEWQCKSRRCTIKGPWDAPTVDACRALAQQVGAIKSYGRSGKKLNAQELAQCNTGLAVPADKPTTTRPGSKVTEAPTRGMSDPSTSRTSRDASPDRTPVPKKDETSESRRPPRVTATTGAQWKPTISSIRPATGSVIWNGVSEVIIKGRDLLPVHSEAVPPKPGETTYRQAETKKLAVRQLNADYNVVFSATFGAKTVEKWYRIAYGTGAGTEVLSWNDTEIRARLRGETQESGNYRVQIHEIDPRREVIATSRVQFRAEAADKDRDGHLTTAAGGDDCDDNDRNRYYGNIEVADFDGHDEDCNPATIGNLDQDRDGYVDCRVFNWTSHIDVNVGEDCDDGRTNVNPRSTEACNNRDDNCNGIIDEELIGCPTAGARATDNCTRSIRYRPAAPGATPRKSK